MPTRKLQNVNNEVFPGGRTERATTSRLIVTARPRDTETLSGRAERRSHVAAIGKAEREVRSYTTRARSIGARRASDSDIMVDVTERASNGVPGGRTVYLKKTKFNTFAHAQTRETQFYSASLSAVRRFFPLICSRVS